MRKTLFSTLLATAAVAAVPVAADITIFTGGAPTGEGSTYHNGFGQGVAEFLEPIADDLGMDVVLVPTNGAVENATLVAAHEGIAFGIGQGGLTYAEVEAGEIAVARNDLPGECAMAFSAEPRIKSWGDVVENAEIITWVAPEGSGSAAFVTKIYELDGNFEGATANFDHASGKDAIIAKVDDPTSRGKVGLFYAYPNPTSGLINAAAGSGLSIFGILSPDVARTDDSYYLNRKAPYELSWFGFGETKTTRAMCSKALLFAIDPDGISDPWTRDDAKTVLEAIEAAPADAFVPKGGSLAKLMSTVEGLSEEYGVNEMVSDLETQVRNASESLR